MNNLLHLLKELKVPAMEEFIFVKPFDETASTGTYQTEIDFESLNDE